MGEVCCNQPARRRRGMLRLVLALVLLTLAPLPGDLFAQTPAPASLIADTVSYDGETDILTATGNVEVFYDGRVLKAASVSYDRNADRISATGPVTLTDPGGTVFLADGASLSPDLAAGLISGARLLIAGELQMAAAEAQRIDDRFTVLHNTIATSCMICEENPRPTWSIRARRITRDELDQRIYLEDATFLAFGVPIAWLPQASIPDPAVTRASGFLLPEYNQSEIYGTGLQIPYYWAIDDESDATVTPFISTGGAFLLEGEYRKRFSNGGFDLGAVLAISDGQGDSGRGAWSGNGSFALRHGFTAEFDFERASDKSFLQQFDYSDADRLTSEASISRSRLNEYTELTALNFQTLRDGENQDTVPLILPTFRYQLAQPMPGIGGRYEVLAEALGVTRNVGEKMFRMGGGMQWNRTSTGPVGIQARTFAGADVDAYQVWDNPEFDDGILSRIYPNFGIDLRWPLLRAGGRASHVIEPIAQVLYSKIWGAESVPNEDSRLPELDETNLFSLDRFPGRDAVETGLRANLGVRYTRYDPAGWSMGLTLGQILRAEADEAFPAGSGLQGPQSDFVGSVALNFDSGLTVTNRALVETDMKIRRNEFALYHDADWGYVGAGYTFLAEDDSNPTLGDQPETNEFGLEASYRVHRNWDVRGLWRYDMATGSSLKAEGGITYGNECAEFDLSVSRRFTSSVNVPPSTSVSFVVRLAGLGNKGVEDWPSRTCTLSGI